MAKTATPPTPVQSAKPGTVDDKAKKPSRGRYPIAEGTLLEKIPDDFDPKKHLPLRSKDFKDEAVYFEAQAARFEKMAANMRKRAEDSKKLGGVKEKAKAKQLLKMQERMAALMADLQKQGVNTDELLAAVAKPAPAAEAAPAPTAG